MESLIHNPRSSRQMEIRSLQLSPAGLLRVNKQIRNEFGTIIESVDLYINPVLQFERSAHT